MIGMLRVLFAMVGCIVFSASSFAGGPFGIISVGRWQGAAYTNEKGVFSHCIASAKFSNGAQKGADVLVANLRIALMCLGSDARPHVVEPAVEKLSKCGLARLDISADLDLRDQSRALDLSLTLGSGKRMPLAFAPAGFWITHLDDDCPMTR